VQEHQLRARLQKFELDLDHVRIMADTSSKGQSCSVACNGEGKALTVLKSETQIQAQYKPLLHRCAPLCEVATAVL
jgi:hypothetical protein